MRIYTFSPDVSNIWKSQLLIIIFGLLSIQVQAQSDANWSNPYGRSALRAYDKGGSEKKTTTTSYREQSYNFYESYSLTLSNQSRYFHVIDIYDEPITGNPLTGKYGFYEGMCVIERKSNPRNFASNSGGQSYKRVSFEKMGLSKDKAAAVYYIINKYPSLDRLSNSKLEEVQEAIRYLTREISKDSQGTNNTIAQEAYNNRFKYLGKVYFLVFYKGGYVYNQDFIKWKTADIKLGGKVFNDANDNGKKDSGENGISGVQVYLYPDYNGDGVKDSQIPIGTVTTDNNGEYEFLVNDDTYIVEIEMPTGYIPGYIGNKANPTDNANDDDGVVVNGRRLSTKPFRSGVRENGNAVSKENKKISFGIIGGNSLMGITKTASPSGIVSIGDVLTYTITLTNEGNTDLKNVTLRDVLPNSLDYVPGTAKRTYYKAVSSQGSESGRIKINAVPSSFDFNTKFITSFTVGQNDGVPVGAQIQSIEMNLRGKTLGTFNNKEHIKLTFIAPNGSQEIFKQFGSGRGNWNFSGTGNEFTGDVIGKYTMIWEDTDDNPFLNPEQEVHSGNVFINWTRTVNNSARKKVTESINSLDNLFVKSDGVSLEKGETITVTLNVKVNDKALLEVVNTAIANSDNASEVTGFAINEVTAPAVKNNSTFAVNDINQTPANVAVRGNVLTNDYDLEGDVQTVTAINGQTVTSQGVSGIKVSGTDLDGNFVDNAGTISINPDGTYLFTPAKDFKGTAKVEYTVGDGNNNFSTANIAIKVIGANKDGRYPPVAQDDNIIMTPNTPAIVDVLVNDSDVDGTLNKASVGFDITGFTNAQGKDTDGDRIIDEVTVANEGTWTVNKEGKVTFNPNTGFTGNPTPIIYTVKDNDGLTDSATITITTDSSDKSIQKLVYAYDDASTGDVGDTMTGTISGKGVLANDTDINGNGLHVESAQAPINADGTYGNLKIGEATVVYGSAVDNPNKYVEAGTLTLKEDGSYTYVSNPKFIGSVYIPYTAENFNKEDKDKATLYLTTVKRCSTLSFKVFLEGPYEETTGLMRTALNKHHLLPGQDKELSPLEIVNLAADYTPFGQPYQGAPWNYNGILANNYGDISSPSAPNKVINYPETVVDWVLVTLRKGGVKIANDDWQCAGLLHSDGQVTFPKECPCLDVDYDEDYYILVEHRNHLPAISLTPVTKNKKSRTLTYDFTTQDSYSPLVYGVGQKEIKKGIWAMFAGNGDQTQINSINAIDSGDNTIWAKDQNGVSYLLGDYDMSVFTDSGDRVIWGRNQNTTTYIELK